MARTRKLRALLPLAALLAVVGGLAFAARATELGHFMELKTLDWRFRRLCDPARHDERIVLVMLDQPSLDHFEKESLFWPWPRSMYGAALKFLKAGGSRAIVFDILFTSPSPYGQAEDEALGKAIKEAGNVVMAMETGREAHALRLAPPPARFAVESLAAGFPAPRKGSVRLPVPELAGSARALGDTSVAPDTDSVFRRMPLVVEMDGRRYPTLSLAAALAAGGGALDRVMPALVDGNMLVRYHGKALSADPRLKTYAVYALGDLILSWQALEEGRKPALDPALFKDKIVFIGMSAAGLLDNRPSPISGIFPGTEIVATAADNLLNGDPLRRAPEWSALALILLALLAAAAASRLAGGAAWGSAAVLGASAALGGAAAAAFRGGLWLDMAAPQLALWLGFAASSAYGYAVEGRKKRFIHKAFSHYLSPEIVDQIAASPGSLSLGGERRDVTFYFSDIEGFTTISESLPPDRLTLLMNRYLGEMTETILTSGGTLDKYIGDAIMAFWGAPMPREDHALTACRVALANQAKLAQLREQFISEGFPPVRNRIGLNSGPASIGNMGSPKRFSYTAIGDNVNLASRLEGANKAYGTYILISESTRQAAGAAIETRELDFVKVKGKNIAIKIYELLGLRGETPAALLEKARLFESGLSLYRSRRFSEAETVFQKVLADFGEDHSSEDYLERCRLHRATSPAADWDGSHALTEK